MEDTDERTYTGEQMDEIIVTAALQILRKHMDAFRELAT